MLALRLVADALTDDHGLRDAHPPTPDCGSPISDTRFPKPKVVRCMPKSAAQATSASRKKTTM